MNFLTNAEIAKKYGLSRATITNWVNKASEGKNGLKLTTHKEKQVIIDSPHNESEINRLVLEGKKWKRNVEIKSINISNELKYFNSNEIIEIINDLEFNKEVNLKYSYKNGGAKYWDQRYLSGMSPIKSSTLELTSTIYHDLNLFLDSESRLNIIDIGPGNSHPIKSFIGILHTQNKINKYIPIDISEDIIEISQKNISEWFPTLEFKSYISDIEFTRFDKIFFENQIKDENLRNIVLFIGNTIVNFDDKLNIFKTIRSGMTEKDYFIITFTLDTDLNKSVLNYAKSPEANYQHTWLLKTLGIDVDLCEIILEYDAKLNAKIKKVKLDKDYEIKFQIFNEEKLVKLHNKEEITVWKHYLSNLEDFQQRLTIAGLKPLVIRLDSTESNAIIICKPFI